MAQKYIVHTSIGRAINVEAENETEAEEQAVEQIPLGWGLISTEVETPSE